MSSITEILSTDLITDSRADINNNFTALNNDKIETSVIDTDTTLAANSDAKIPSQKAIKAYVDSLSEFSISSESSAATTHSLTTDGTQRVVVFAKGSFTGSASSQTLTLAYNGVTKDTVTVENGTSGHATPCFVMYTETPPAATANITLSLSGGSFTEPMITVIKFNV